MQWVYFKVSKRRFRLPHSYLC